MAVQIFIGAFVIISTAIIAFCCLKNKINKYLALVIAFITASIALLLYLSLAHFLGFV